MTPPEVLVLGAAAGRTSGSRGWRVRVVPNLYSAFARPPAAGGLPGPGESVAADGAAEVIISSPRHEDTLATMAPEQARLAVEAWAQRARHWKAQPGVRQVLLLVNQGRAAGASLPHPHEQLFALGHRLPDLQGEITLAGARCPLCEWPRTAGDLLVAEEGGVIAMCAFAPRYPFETWILPAQHEESFETTPAERLDAFTLMLQRILRGLGTAGYGEAWNLVLHTSPTAGGRVHWHAELMPRDAIWAGFELGTGVSMVSVRPEDAARALRSALGS